MTKKNEGSETTGSEHGNNAEMPAIEQANDAASKQLITKSMEATEVSQDPDAEKRRNMLRKLRANPQSRSKGLAARKLSGSDDSADGGGNRQALRKLLANRRASGDNDVDAGGGQNRGQLLQMLLKRRRKQGGEGPEVDANSSPDEIAAHRERLESRAERLERALKGVLAEIDEMRDLERRATAAADNSAD